MESVCFIMIDFFNAIIFALYIILVLCFWLMNIWCITEWFYVSLFILMKFDVWNFHLFDSCVVFCYLSSTITKIWSCWCYSTFFFRFIISFILSAWSSHCWVDTICLYVDHWMYVVQLFTIWWYVILFPAILWGLVNGRENLSCISYFLFPISFYSWTVY